MAQPLSQQLLHTGVLPGSDPRACRRPRGWRDGALLFRTSTARALCLQNYILNPAEIPRAPAALRLARLALDVVRSVIARSELWLLLRCSAARGTVPTPVADRGRKLTNPSEPCMGKARWRQQVPSNKYRRV